MNVILDPGAFMPEFAHKTDAGADLRSPVEAVVPAHGSVVIDTGVHVEVPEGYTIFLKSKSGLNVKYNLIGEGVIDSGYTSSIRVKLYNLGNKDYIISKGDKIIQMIILPCAYWNSHRLINSQRQNVEMVDLEVRGGNYGKRNCFDAHTN